MRGGFVSERGQQGFGDGGVQRLLVGETHPPPEIRDYCECVHLPCSSNAPFRKPCNQHGTSHTEEFITFAVHYQKEGEKSGEAWEIRRAAVGEFPFGNLCAMLLSCAAALRVVASEGTAEKQGLELRVRTSKYLVGMSCEPRDRPTGHHVHLHALTCHVGAHCQPSREGLKQAGRNSPSSKAWPLGGAQGLEG